MGHSVDRIGPSVDRIGPSVDKVSPSMDRVPFLSSFFLSLSFLPFSFNIRDNYSETTLMASGPVALLDPLRSRWRANCGLPIIQVGISVF